MLRAVLVTVAIGIFGLCQGSLGSKPTIFPPSDHVINEGEELIIRCESDKIVTFAYPNNSYAITSEVEIIRENNTLLRRPSVYGDTGWYACAEEGVDIPYDNSITEHNEPDIAWTYVYVKSEDHKFILEKDGKVLTPRAGSTFIIDCRATSPYLEVHLYNINDEIVIDDRVSYDHKVGFTWRKMTVEDGGDYECGVDGVADRTKYSYYIDVKTQQTLPSPVIVGGQKQYVRRGETFIMNCSVDAVAGVKFDFKWRRHSHKENDTELNIVHDRKPKGRSTMIYVCQLVLKNVKDSDGGEYDCYLNDNGKIKHDTVSVLVLEPHTSHINLTVQDNKHYYEVHHGGKVTLVVNVEAFPKPELTWYKIGTPCEKIYEGRMHDHRYVKPQKLLSQTVMEIRTLKFDDTGMYQVKAVKDDVIRYSNIFVNVTGKPIVAIDKVQNTFLPDKFAKFVCRVEANPKPDVKWVYEKCFDYRTCKDKSSFTINKSNNTWKSDIHLVSEVNVMIDTFGSIRCIANNSHGHQENNTSISVSDVEDLFGIIETQETFTEGDDVKLTCAASLVNYSSAPEWSRSDGRKLDDGIDVKFRQTKFTNQSILTIRNVRKSHGGIYKCSVLDIDDRLQSATHELRIIDPAAPTIKKSESQINVHKGGNLTVPCTVYGTPFPTVTWYKDDKPLIDKEFSFNDRGQKLIKSVVLEEHEGRYCCIAENRVSNAKKCVDIIVAGKTGVPVYWFGIIGVFTVIVVILITYLCYKVNRERKLKRELMEVGLTHFEEGAMECLNPDLTVDDQAELLPYDKKWEFPRDRLKLGELLVIVEYCRFGNLHNYLQRHRIDFINQIDPATDKIDPTIDPELLMRTTSVSSSNKIKYAALSFSRSISINSAGRSSANEAVEYRPGPDSEGVVMSPDGCVLSNNTVQPGWRSNYHGDYKDKNLKPICTKDLLCWAFQVARGMEYLSFRKVLHGDLAARNILLAENNVVKICDFGLAKTMYKDNNYKKKSGSLLPIKWMAIESIRDGVFSTQSDVWSFGIVLWEFFTLAETPYPGLAAEEQYQKLIEGHRMKKPEFATKEIYDIMLHCWKAKQTLRPSFTELAENIGGFLEDSVKNHYVNLNTPYLDMNTMTLENGKSDYLMMMSAPDHTALSYPGPCVTSETGKDAVYLCMSPNSQVDDTVIFSPRHESEKTRFNFPTLASPVFSDSDDAVEVSPMLSEQDPYMKPINVQQRRAEFTQLQQHKEEMDKATERDSGYPRSPMHPIDLNGAPDDKKRESNMLSPKGNAKEYTPTIINTNDINYVNMPQQKIDRCKETGNFSNPNYMLMNNAQDNNRFV